MAGGTKYASIIHARVAGWRYRTLCAQQAVGQPVRRPSLAFSGNQFSEMQPPTLQRKWTAVVSVDASRCAMNSAGHFEICFKRLGNRGRYRIFEEFVWLPPSVASPADFWADEAVERYWITNVSTCPCGEVAHSGAPHTRSAGSTKKRPTAAAAPARCGGSSPRRSVRKASSSRAIKAGQQHRQADQEQRDGVGRYGALGLEPERAVIAKTATPNG